MNNGELTIENGDLTMKNSVFTMKNWDVNGKIGDLTQTVWFSTKKT
jgi:hypothetical protein